MMVQKQIAQVSARPSTLPRASKAVILGFALLALAGCNENARNTTNARHFVALSPQIKDVMAQKGLTAEAPILLRAFKKEGELEVWKQNSAGEFQHLKTYPICRWSGQLGPKTNEGDRQVPEGFYAITPAQMNPNSAFFLSFNVGYPNAFDRAHGRDGGQIMVHGACSSRGCFSMTDEQIADIYALTREAFSGGQKSVQLQSLPFRFSAENLARYRADENLPFWKNLKEGADHFDLTKREPQVSVCSRKYVFNSGAQADPSGPCSVDGRDAALHASVAEKAKADEVKVAELVSTGVKPVKRIYQDGDQHPHFKAIADASHHAATTGSGLVSPRPAGVSRIANVSREEELAHGAVDLPAEQARGLSRAQLIARAEEAKRAQARLAELPVPATPAASPVQTAAAPPSLQSRNVPAQANALLAADKRRAEESPFYQKWIGAFGGLLAQETPQEPVVAPLPPRR
jgi:murein L,D-transpeptidase YafK